MKRIIVGIAILTLIATSAFAAPFAPATLKISASPFIQYDFDGKALTVPVTVSGTPAAVSFLVFTKDKGAAIGKVVNGYLGWHEVNKIDTCVYASAFQQLEKGSGSIVWDGKDKDGKLVPAGEYTYYMFGYDNMSPRIQMTKAITINPWGFRTIITHDAAGNPMNNPLWYISDASRPFKPEITVHKLSKWTVGNDPQDTALLETCADKGWCDTGGLAFLSDQNFTKYFFHDTLRNGSTKVTQKWEWVPNGDAVIQSEWGDNGQFTYTGQWLTDDAKAYWNYGPGCINDNKGTLFLVNADISGQGTQSELIYLDITDGSEMKRFDLSSWWVDMDDGAAGGQNCGGPTEICNRNGFFFMGSHSSCVNMMIDPYATDDADVVKWVNGNGDVLGDHNYEADAKLPWVCNDYVPGPYKYSTSADANNFTVFSCFGVGAVSFGLYAPDGYGMGYQALAGETDRQKFGVEFIDYSSPYDGIYTTNNTGASGVDTTIWFNASDSIKGTISTIVGVANAAPAAFAVAQNSPNPFNPTTTISFTLAKAGKTTVDVYNVAGQKISTLVNGTMSAGSHSVTWNAAKFSAGVYFYTVKSGDFSKTMKMTLLK